MQIARAVLVADDADAAMADGEEIIESDDEEEEEDDDSDDDAESEPASDESDEEDDESEEDDEEEIAELDLTLADAADDEKAEKKSAGAIAVDRMEVDSSDLSAQVVSATEKSTSTAHLAVTRDFSIVLRHCRRMSNRKHMTASRRYFA